ncbi:MAG: NAD-dependent succinate-semialdehyde dehydrogenase [Xanthobacteraceae bacterium]|nr:NAD-dependent succinate-semialdehyde dehydrogenase [Xanthobacteraceae bacterium]
MYTDLALHIDGQWLNGDGRSNEDVINPATEKPLGKLPHASAADLDRVLVAAKKGFDVWRNTNPYERSKVLRKAASLVRERADKIARIMTQEQGKPLGEARLEVLVTADIIDWYAEEGRRSYGRIVQGRQKNVRQMVMQEPVGVVAAFTPWNFPTLTPARKIGGALAAGCSLILKASEETPGSCVELVRCVVEAGAPPGVLNLVFGVPAKVSEHLIPSDIVRKVSFTGSIPVGKHLAALAAKGVKRTTLELGGHSPVVVFGDADPEKTADTIAAFKYRNAGQVCISPTRFYVQEPVYDRFLKRFTDFANNIKLGDGLEDGTTMGPMANARRLDALEGFVNDAKNRGGKVVTGGKRRGNQGYYFEPTVVTDIPDDSKVMTEEPFGPIAPIVTFKTFDEVVARANALPFGLAAYAFTSSVSTATAIGDALESGMVGVNSVAISTPETPFGGVKESGYGSEGGVEGLEAYTVTKFISQA